MPDESDDYEVEVPITGARSAPLVDEGLIAWANLVHDPIASQGGVEILQRQGSSIHFKFRGQTFAVTVQRLT